MRAARSLLCALGLFGAAGWACAADQPYWVCIDEFGTKSVQDHACAYAPDAPASGTAVVPRPSATRGHAAHPTLRGSSMDTGAYWRHWFGVWRERLIDPKGVGAVLHQPLFYVALGALCLLLISWQAWRRIAPRLRERRLEREARAMIDPYKAALGEIVRKAPLTRQPISVEPPAPGSSEARWSPTLLRQLRPAQFAALALGLWRLRGMRADRIEGGSRIGDSVLLLRHPAAEGLHGVVLCRPRRAQVLGRDAVQELAELMQRHGSEYGALMCPGEFDLEARDAVRGQQIELKGAVTIMTELDALSDERRSALMDEVLRTEEPNPKSALASTEPRHVAPTLGP